MPQSIVYNMDCMEYMRSLPDKAFDLAVVDPIYGDVTSGGYITGKSRGGVGPHTKHHDAIWKQKKTGADYFQELFRVSKNQIVFGGNYFTKEIQKDSQGWIVWDKSSIRKTLEGVVGRLERMEKTAKGANDHEADPV